MVFSLHFYRPSWSVYMFVGLGRRDKGVRRQENSCVINLLLPSHSGLSYTSYYLLFTRRSRDLWKALCSIFCLVIVRLFISDALAEMTCRHIYKKTRICKVFPGRMSYLPIEINSRLRRPFKYLFVQKSRRFFCSVFTWKKDILIRKFKFNLKATKCISELWLMFLCHLCWNILFSRFMQ